MIADTPATTGPLRRRPGLLLLPVLVLYLLLALRLVFLLPLWGAVQDEPIHFGYAKYLAVRGSLPVIAPTGAPNLGYYYTAPSAGDAAHHPPGYYFVASLVLRLFGHASLATQNYAVRCTSALLGLIALLFIYAALRRLLPDRPCVAVAMVAAVALFPHWLMVCSTIHPESFGAAAASLLLWALAGYRQDPSRWQRALLVGALAGLLALAKMTMLPFCLAAVITLLVLASRRGLTRRTQLLHLALLGCAAVVVCGWWFARNWAVYGQFTPSTDLMLGTTTHTRLFLRDGSQDMIAFLFIPQGQMRYQLALQGAFRYFWSPGDWLPPAARPVMYALGGLIWLVVPVGLWLGLRRQQPDLVALWRPFTLPFLVGSALLFAMYVRWTVLVAIQAHAELGRWLMPQMGNLALMWTLAVQGLVGRRSTTVALGLLALFCLTWDVLSIHHIATVLIPLHGAPTAPTPGALTQPEPSWLAHCFTEKCAARIIPCQEALPMGLIVSREAFAAFRDTLSPAARVVFTNGCFDLLHVGHMHLLNFARSLGDSLVVGLNSDASVKRFKGPDRPIVRQEERAEILAALAPVDFVIIFDEDDPRETIRAVKPRYHVKGGDYAGQRLIEADEVEAHGGEVVLATLVDNRSTTRLIQGLKGHDANGG